MNISWYNSDIQSVSSRINWLDSLRRVFVIAALLLLILATLPGILRGGEFNVVSVSGESMGQAVPNKSIVITREVSAESLRVDDVIVFDASWLDQGVEDRNVVHRLDLIVATPEGLMGYTTGDANIVSDPEPVGLQGDVSVVRAVVPFIGMFYMVPSSTIFFVVAGIMFLVGLMYLPKISRYELMSAKQLIGSGPTAA